MFKNGGQFVTFLRFKMFRETAQIFIKKISKQGNSSN